MKRIRWEVRYSRKNNFWIVYRAREIVDYGFWKASAIKYATESCRSCFALRLELSELTIKRKDGTIQDKRTYGRDPRRSKG